MLRTLPLPSSREVALVVTGAALVIASIAVNAAPAPWCNILPLPLAILGSIFAAPVLCRFWD